MNIPQPQVIHIITFFSQSRTSFTLNFLPERQSHLRQVCLSQAAQKGNLIKNYINNKKGQHLNNTACPITV